MGMRERFSRFMQGRYGAYGPDRFSRALSVFTIVLIVVSLFIRNSPLSYVAFALVAYSLYRTLSKNYAARQRENAAFARVADKAAPFIRRFTAIVVPAAKGAARGTRRFVKNAATRARHFRTHRFYKCPGCGSQLRVPKVRGRLQISCPKCGRVFTTESRKTSAKSADSAKGA